LKQKTAKRFEQKEAKLAKPKGLDQQTPSPFADFVSFLSKTPLLTFVVRVLLRDPAREHFSWYRAFRTIGNHP
jgi:hypothetical protein